MGAYMAGQGPQVATTSRIQVWWLIIFRGYHIVGGIQEPRRSILGHIQYATSWLLEGRAPGNPRLH